MYLTENSFINTT